MFLHTCVYIYIHIYIYIYIYIYTSIYVHIWKRTHIFPHIVFPTCLMLESNGCARLFVAKGAQHMGRFPFHHACLMCSRCCRGCWTGVTITRCELIEKYMGPLVLWSTFLVCFLTGFWTKHTTNVKQCRALRPDICELVVCLHSQGVFWNPFFSVSKSPFKLVDDSRGSHGEKDVINWVSANQLHTWSVPEHNLTKIRW